VPIPTRIGVKFEYRDHGLKKVLSDVSRLNLTKLRVGVVGPKASQPTTDGRLTNAENAVIQQYGLAGPPGSPPRDFLNGPFLSARAVVASVLRRVCGRVIQGETPEQAVDWAGSQLQKIPRDAIMSSQGISPRNAAATVAKKGFDHPLVDHLDLYDAISHQVIREGGDLLEAGSSIGDYEAFEIGGK
jgi:hypothetical protein